MIARLAQALRQRVRLRVIEPLGSTLSRPGARLRWSVVGVAVVLLCAAPTLVAAFPVSAPSRSVPQLIEAIHSSGSVAYSGYAESRGTLALPDVSSVSNPLADLLSDRSRLRVWHAADQRFRVDRLTVGAESDVYVYGNISLTWDSDQRTVIRSVAASQLPQPQPPDVLPSALGRRIVEQLPADGAGVSKVGSDRVAGRAAVELRWRPNDPKSLVGDVRLWVDPTNGLVLRVQLRPVGSNLIAFETSFLDLKLGTPEAKALQFDVAGTPRADVQDTVPPGPQDSNPAFQLPATLGGLPQRSPQKPLVATYGRASALVAVIALDNATADSLRAQIDSPGRPPIRTPFGPATAVEAPMLRGLIFSSGDRGYVLAGTVPLEVLESMGQQLVNNPPDRGGT